MITEIFMRCVVCYSGNGKLASCGCIIGFVVMMALDVGLG